MPVVLEEEWVETVPAATVLLEQLQETPPGPELATLLASVDRSSLDAEGLLRLAHARQRLIAHQEAEFLSDLHAIARAVPNQGSQPGRKDPPGRYPWAEVEAACALRWSYGRAGAHMILADEVIDRLPAIHTALAAGLLDMPKVHLMTELVAPLDDEPARRVLDKVIDTAPRQTPAELRARLRRLVLAVDHQALTKRARRSSGDRRVRGYLNDNQLANLAGYDLAPQRVAAIMERLDAIARAAKAAGDPATPTSSAPTPTPTCSPATASPTAHRSPTAASTNRLACPSQLVRRTPARRRHPRPPHRPTRPCCTPTPSRRLRRPTPDRPAACGRAVCPNHHHNWVKTRCWPSRSSSPTRMNSGGMRCGWPGSEDSPRPRPPAAQQ